MELLEHVFPIEPDGFGEEPCSIRENRLGKLLVVACAFGGDGFYLHAERIRFFYIDIAEMFEHFRLVLVSPWIVSDEIFDRFDTAFLEAFYIRVSRMEKSFGKESQLNRKLPCTRYFHHIEKYGEDKKILSHLAFSRFSLYSFGHIFYGIYIFMKGKNTLTS